MARQTKPLTNTEIDKTKSKDKIYSLFDGGGLELKIYPNGNKQWLFKYYKPHTKKRTNISAGRYPSITLANARKLREQYQELLTNRKDPKDERQKAETSKNVELANTLKAVALNWLDVKKNHISADHAKDIWRSLELHIFPELGNS